MHRMEAVDGGSLLPTKETETSPAPLCNHVSYYACMLSLIYCTVLSVVQGGSAQSISKIIYCYPTTPYCRAGRVELRTAMGQHCHNSVPADHGSAQVLAHTRPSRKLSYLTASSLRPQRSCYSQAIHESREH
jgi:hypothetical protein